MFVEGPQKDKFVHEKKNAKARGWMLLGACKEKDVQCCTVGKSFFLIFFWEEKKYI